ncbi:hypothetical protein Mapa_013367 [Marchantia paleacea]|nr:hypothetical protein Mapa_013367 [Marchantia paleacea]
MTTIGVIQPDLVLSNEFPESTFEYTERDVALYALGVGAPGINPTDPLEIPYIYTTEGQTSVKVLPTFAVVWSSPQMVGMASMKGLHYDDKLILHGQQYMETYRPFPPCGTIRSTARISGLHDMGQSAVLELEFLHRDAETRELLCLTRFTFFLRGAGGFSCSKPFTYTKKTTNLKPVASAIPLPISSRDAAPFAVYEDQIHTSQALLYRLSTDYWPHASRVADLHADPERAAQAGFEQPVLQGSCTLGFAIRAVVRICCHGDSSRVQSIQGRFLAPIYPGQKLVTEMWLDDSHSVVTYVCKVSGRNVMSGFVTLTSSPAPFPSRL